MPGLLVRFSQKQYKPRMSEQLFQSIVQLVVAMGGGILVLLGIWYKDRLETSAKMKFTRYQIAAEIRALLDIIEVNHFLPKIHAAVADMRAGGEKVFAFSANRDFTPVYDANLQHLGLLEECSGDVVRFYMMIRSAMEESENLLNAVNEIREARAAGRPENPRRNFDYVLDCQETLLVKISTSVELGDKVYWELMRQVPPPKKPKKPQGQLVNAVEKKPVRVDGPRASV